MLASEISGVEGKVTYPRMGALIGYFAQWKLSSPDKVTYRFTATFGYVNPKLWELEGYERRITVQIGKGKTYLIEQPNGGSLELNDRTLKMDGVILTPMEVTSGK